MENEAPGLPAPSILFSTDLGTEDFALAVGLYTPWAGRLRFPSQGPQRYALVDMTGSMIMYQHIALAWQPHPRVAIGAGLQNIMAILDGVGVASTFVGIWGEPEDYDLDSTVHIRATDLFTLTANFGVWVSPIDGFEIAASVQLPATISDAKARFETQLPSHYVFDTTSVEGDTMGLELDLPWMARVALRYVWPDLFDVEIMGWFEGWSRQEKIRTIPNNVRIVDVPTVGSIQADRLNLDRRLRDILGVAIGGDYHLFPFLTLRAGFMMEQGATPDVTYSVFQHDSSKYAPTVGVTWKIDEMWRLDFAYTHIFQGARSISNSEVVQINSAYPEGATVVGNGEYRSSYDVVGLGMVLHF